MVIRKASILLFLVFSLSASAQNEAGYFRIGRMMSRIPDSLTWSTNGISSYINAHFTSQKEKSRAAFIWIARNITYNFDSLFSPVTYSNSSEISERILRTRTGVCRQYAELFNELANKSGIRSFVIQGYTKQHGVVDYLPHLWCGAFVDSAWCLFDPTWGSGYIANGRFIHQVNNYYFMTNPEDLIRTHMPFDPIWQFLNHTVTVQEFYGGNYRNRYQKPFFNFQDTLEAYESASEIDKAIASARRITQNGVKNSFTEAKLRILKSEIENYRNITMTDQYNLAVNLFNKSVIKLNQFIEYGNNQFLPETDSNYIHQMLDSSEYYLSASEKSLSAIINPSEQLIVSIIQLSKYINDTRKVVNDQRFNLRKFLSFRKKF